MLTNADDTMILVMINELIISKYNVEFVLGNNADERKSPRRVVMNIHLRFVDPNLACSSDNLRDTICYDALIQFLNEKLLGAQFNLIEKSAKYVYDLLGEFLKDEKIMRRVELIKENPMSCVQTATFVCSDW